MIGGGAGGGGGITGRVVGRAGRVGRFVESNVEIREHKLRIAQKFVLGFVAWRHPESPLRCSPQVLERGVWHHLGE